MLRALCPPSTMLGERNVPVHEIFEQLGFLVSILISY